VRAEVDARYYDGFVNDATAFIPGETGEEVLVYGHLCHPGPSANDNASGSGVVVELARTLNALITSGKLPKPRRGVRFLLGAEFTGSYAFVANNPGIIACTVAGLNLDMVGQDEEKCGSFLNVEYPPRAIPSYAGDLMSAILDRLVARSEVPFRNKPVPFSGGSDHLLFSDPSIGVPCPMLICHPDKFYHTSADTMDKVSPTTLKRIGLMAGTYLYFLANAGENEARWLAHEMVTRFTTEAASYCESEITSLAERGRATSADLTFAQNRLDYLCARKAEDLRSVSRLAGDSAALELESLVAGMETFAASEKRRLCSAVGAILKQVSDVLPPEPTPAEERAPVMVPKRVYPGPVNVEAFISKSGPSAESEYRALSARMPRHSGANLPLHLGFWMDGKRNLHEIMDLVRYETGRYEPDWTLDYVEFLARIGLVEITQIG
jgi:hypothetical protein